MREIDYEVQNFLSEAYLFINFDKKYSEDRLKEELIYDIIDNLNKRDFIWLNNYLSNKNNLGELYIYDATNNIKLLNKYNKEHNTNYKYAIGDEDYEIHYYEYFKDMYHEFDLANSVVDTLLRYYSPEVDYIVKMYKDDCCEDDDDYEYEELKNLCNRLICKQ